MNFRDTYTYVHMYIRTYFRSILIILSQEDVIKIIEFWHCVIIDRWSSMKDMNLLLFTEQIAILIFLLCLISIPFLSDRLYFICIKDYRYVFYLFLIKFLN